MEEETGVEAMEEETGVVATEETGVVDTEEQQKGVEAMEEETGVEVTEMTELSARVAATMRRLCSWADCLTSTATTM